LLQAAHFGSENWFAAGCQISSENWFAAGYQISSENWFVAGCPIWQRFAVDNSTLAANRKFAAERHSAANC
jgi:hypothetical protein